MRVAALGRTQMLADSITALRQAGHEIVLVATCRARPGQRVTEEHFVTLADSLSAEFLATWNLNVPEAVGRLRAARAEVAVSVDWPNLLGADACDSFVHGILNAHAGDLPRYRGNSPVAWAMLGGETRVGLTIHRMDPAEYDAGPILCKEYFEITAETYVRDVFDFVEARVPHLFVAAVDAFARGEARLLPQSTDPGAILRCYPRTDADGRIDWRATAQFLSRLVHSTAEPYGGAHTTYQGQRMTVWRTRAREGIVPPLAAPGDVVSRDTHTGEVAVATGAGALVLEEVQTATGRRCRAAEVIRDVRLRLGEVHAPS